MLDKNEGEMGMSIVRKSAVVGVLLASVAPCAAWAQAAPASKSADSATSSDEIVVTARRREEALSKVPISIVALNPDMLAAKSIQNENDLQAAVPGLVIKQSGNANSFNYVIRGQTIDTYTNSPPGVLPYINEAQVVTFSASSFYDLAGIQVLKGPQGTLFGRNTTGGAVLYQTAKPDDKLGGYIKGRAGNLDAYQIEGAINLPLSDTLKVRIAANKTGGGAYVLRLDTGQRYGNLEQTSVRGSVLWEPTANFKNTLVIQHTSDGGTNAPGAIYHSSAYACGSPGGYTQSGDCAYAQYYFLVPGAAALSALKLGVVGLANAQDKLGPYTVYGSNSSLLHTAKSTFVINTTEYRFSSDMLLKNIFMFNDSNSNDKNDYDGSPFPLIGNQGVLKPDLTSPVNEGIYFNSAKQYSDELQLQGTAAGGKLNYTVGAYFIYQKNLFNSEVSFFDFYPLKVYGATTYVPVHYIQETSNQSIAGFAQGTYAMTDRLNVTVGVRYSRDLVKAKQLPGSDWYGCVPAVCGAAGVSPAYPERSTASKPSWNFSVDYRLAPGLMAYATTRGSWRSGSFNYSLAPNPALATAGGNAFLPETTRDVEVGLKYSGRDLGFPVSFNIDGYNQWVTNIQRGANLLSPVTGTAILATVSVPKAQITGFEADMSARPAEWLTLGASISYTNARFTDNVVKVPGNPPLIYNQYADVPKWSGSLNAELSRTLENHAGTLSLRGDLYFQSKNYFANLGTLIPGTDIAGYQTFGARLAWSEVFGSKVTAAIWGRNLTNTKYYSGGNPTGLSAGFNQAFPGFPRTFGGELKIAF